MNHWLQTEDGVITTCFEHGKQTASQSMPAEKLFSSAVLSIVEVNCAYIAERSCKLPVLLFNSVDKSAQKSDDINRILIRSAQRRGYLDAIPDTIKGF